MREAHGKWNQRANANGTMWDISRRRAAVSIVAFALCLAIFGLAFSQVRAGQSGIVRTSLSVNSPIPVPVERFSQSGASANMVAVVAHGFSASKEIMTSFGVALAGQGITTYCLDFPGHGDSPVPLPDLARRSGLDQLTMAVSEVVDLALRQHPGASLVLIGHSMGTSAIGDYALTHPRLHALAATVLVSPVLTHMPTADNPPNLLILTGENDIPALLPLSRKLIASGCGVATDKVDGDVYTCQGASPRYERRMEILSGLNHISILTASSTHIALLAWLNETVNPAISPAHVIADEQLHWMLLGMLAAALAALPLISLGEIALRLTGQEGEMPEAVDRTRPSWLRNFAVTAAVLAAACAIGLVGLMWVPLEIVHQRLSNNIGGYFLIAGLALVVQLALLPGLRGKLQVPAMRSVPGQVLLAAVVVVLLYLTLGNLSTYLWASMALPPQRLWRAALLAVALLPFFLGTELLISRFRSGAALSFVAHTLSVVFVLAAIYAGILLDAQLVFLALLLPLLGVFLLAFAGMGAWARALLPRPVVFIAMTEALVLAWILAATFPLVA